MEELKIKKCQQLGMSVILVDGQKIGKRKGHPTCRVNRAAGECMAAFKGSRLSGHDAVIGVSLHENK
jgi:hypothetical protein